MIATGAVVSRDRPREGDPIGHAHDDQALAHNHDHPHAHGHEHAHPHEPDDPQAHDQGQERGHDGREREQYATETGSVLVDVGGGQGALVLYLDESYRGREIEISRVGAEHRVHTGVLERRTSNGRVLAAVFGSIAAGSYTMWRDATTAGGTIEVHDGQVTEVRV